MFSTRSSFTLLQSGNDAWQSTEVQTFKEVHIATSVDTLSECVSSVPRKVESTALSRSTKAIQRVQVHREIAKMPERWFF